MKIQNLLKNAIKYCLPTVLSAVVSILVLPLVTRLYPEEEYGYISNFYSIGQMLMEIVVLGLDQAYLRFYYEQPDGSNRNGLFQYVFRIGLFVTSLLLVVVLLFGRRFVPVLLFNDTSAFGIVLLAVYVFELTVYRLFNINYRFSNNVRAYNIQQVVFILCNRLLFVFAALYSTKYIFSAIIMTVSTFMIVAVGAACQKSYFFDGKITDATKREMLRYALPLMPAGVIVLVNNSVAKLILGYFDFRADVGVLAIATSTANVFSIIPSAFSVYWSTFMYQYYKKENDMIMDVHDIVALLCIVLTVGIIFVQDILFLLLGDAYRVSKSYFLLIMLTPICSLLAETTGYGIPLAKKTKYSLFTSLVSLVVNATLCYVLIPRFGVYGAGIGVAASAILNYVGKTVIAQRFYRSIRDYKRSFVGTLVVLFLCIGNTWFSSAVALRLIALLASLVLSILLYRKTVVFLIHGISNWLRTRFLKARS